MCKIWFYFRRGKNLIMHENIFLYTCVQKKKKSKAWKAPTSRLSLNPSEDGAGNERGSDN